MEWVKWASRPLLRSVGRLCGPFYHISPIVARQVALACNNGFGALEVVGA
jgi:hypothetical protein